MASAEGSTCATKLLGATTFCLCGAQRGHLQPLQCLPRRHSWGGWAFVAPAVQMWFLFGVVGALKVLEGGVCFACRVEDKERWLPQPEVLSQPLVLPRVTR